MPRSGERKYDLQYYAEWFSGDTPPHRSLLHARTIHGAEEEAERRFPPRAYDDMLRILGVVRSGSNYRDQPVCVAEQVFPR